MRRGYARGEPGLCRALPRCESGDERRGNDREPRESRKNARGTQTRRRDRKSRDDCNNDQKCTAIANRINTIRLFGRGRARHRGREDHPVTEARQSSERQLRCEKAEKAQSAVCQRHHTTATDSDGHGPNPIDPRGKENHAQRQSPNLEKTEQPGLPRRAMTAIHEGPDLKRHGARPDMC